MTTGSKLLREISDSTTDIESKVRVVASQIDGLERQKGRFATEEANLWSRFAAIQIAGAAELPSQIAAILQKREQRVADARETVANLEKVIAGMEAERVSKESSSESDAKSLRLQKTEAEKSFSGDEKATALRVALTNLADRLSAMQDKLQRAVDEFEEKKVAYDADELFTYLRKRNFDTDQYQGWGLVRRLDGWLANTISYRKSYSGYSLLKSIPDWIKQREFFLTVERDKTAEKVDTIRASHFGAVEPFEIAAQKSAAALAQHDELISEHSRSRNTASQYIAHSALATDDDMNRAIQSFADMLSTKGINSLSEAAARTATQDDDEIVLKLDRIAKQKSQISAQIDALRPGLLEFQRRVKALEEVKSKLQSRGWTGSDDNFNGRITSVDDLALGVITASAFWSSVQTSYQEPPRDYGGYSSGNSSSSSGSANSGSSTSGDSTPTSGGGYGGDSSWSTGGGFGGGDTNSSGGF